MILHCYYCALGGDRRTESSAVAVVDEAKLSKPLRADMFKPLDPKHDLSPPFTNDHWRYMTHRACGRYPWPYDVDLEDGPKRILTDRGIIKIPDVIGDLQDDTDIEVARPVPSAYKCKACGRTFESKQALGGHMRSHNG